MKGEARDRFSELLVRLPVELSIRERHDKAAEVRSVNGGGDAPALPGGVICVVSGQPGDALLNEVRQAADREDAAAVSKALEEYEERLKSAVEKIARDSNGPSVARAIASLPAITEVRYRGKVVAEGMIVHPEMRSMRALLPYAGGKLDPEGFIASTFVPQGGKAEVETIIVVREPELTPLEQKVLDRLPEEVNQLAVGASGTMAGLSLGGTGLALAAGLFIDWRVETWNDDDDQMKACGVHAEAAMARWETNHGGLAWLDEKVELSGQLDQMTAGAAVQTLVQIRTDLLVQDQLW